jgi:hypothetical protein
MEKTGVFFADKNGKYFLTDMKILRAGREDDV